MSIGQKLLVHAFTAKDAITSLLTMMKFIRNWYAVIFLRLGFAKTIFIKSRFGAAGRISSWEEYELFRDELYCANPLIYKPKLGKIWFQNCNDSYSFIYNGIKLTFSKEFLHDCLNVVLIIYETFALEQYKDILSNMPDEIIDIGANIGDSSIYFALNGIKVIAYEPYRKVYLQAIENFKLNNLMDSIKIFNEGVGYSHQTKINNEIETKAGQPLMYDSQGSTVLIRSMSEITSSLDFSKKVSLKIDCEGCEYEFILNASPEELGKFHSIIGEYHYGYLKLLKKFSEVGLRASFSKPHIQYNKDSRTVMLVGNFYAYRDEMK